MTRANEQAEYAEVQRHGKLRPRIRTINLAYVGWILLALLILGLVVASIPAYSAFLHLPRTASALSPDDPGGQLSPVGMQQLQAWGLSIQTYIAYLVINNLLLVFVYLGVGALIVWRTWSGVRDRMALCAAYALAAFPMSAVHMMLGTLPPRWDVTVNILNFLGEISIPLFACLFPVGRFVPRWTGFLALGTVIVWAVYTFVPAASSPASSLAGIVFVLILLSFGCLIGVQVYRYRRVSDQIQRQQGKWVFFGVGVAGSAYIVWSGLFALLYFEGSFTDVPVRSLFTLSQTLLLLLIPLSIGFAILRYRLWDIDLIINRTLVYGALSAVIAGLYVLIVVSLGELLQVKGNLLISLFATGLVAVCIQPFRALLQRSVNRLLYGQRDEPYAVIQQLSRRLKGTLEPGAVLSTIVETVAQALKLPYVAILWKQGEKFELAASFGRQTDESISLPLIYHAETIGRLQLAPRSRGDTFTPVDVRLLDELALQAGLAVHAVRLATDLQKAREHLVLAREEERRRLRRDLHDGVGPTLASISQRIDSARHLVSRDPEAAIVQLGTLKTQIKSTIADIRRVVYALRPPALDELGLVSAVREHVMHLQETNDLHISIEAPPNIPPLPAAVEVAAYRIALEALTNVERHAQAHSCLIRLELLDERTLGLSIIDDGCGIPVEHHAGVGILSMRERTAELGGECTITTMTEGGTSVAVRLPLQSSRDL